MKLSYALKISSYSVITVIGGGGKTSTLLTLADELREEQKKAFITTTTKMAASELAAFPVVYAENFQELLQKIRVEFHKHDQIALGLKVSNDGKVHGIPPEWVDKLAILYPDYWILVEGDGAARKPFKAPSGHEPVIPSSTKLVIAVVGVEVIGQVLLESYVHRADLISRLSNLPLGKILTPTVICDVVMHPQGYHKAIPVHSSFAVVINKVDSSLAQKRGRELAHLLLSRGVTSIVLTSFKSNIPVREVFYS